jgi:DNA-binding transcriptional regulator GbsR (MarR family)
MSDVEVMRLFLKLGFTLSAATVLTVLFSAKNPMCFGEIVKATGYAKGHVSQILKQLEARKIVERIYEGKKVQFRLKKNALSELLLEHLVEIKKSIEPFAMQSFPQDDRIKKLVEKLNEAISGDGI